MAKPAMAEEDGVAKKKTYADLKKELDSYQKQFKKWLKRYDAILKRYRRETQETETEAADNTNPKFNVLYANISILQGAVYNHIPSPLVMRRFTDKDPVGRTACDILQRALKESLEECGIDDTLKSTRDDYLLAARGTCWVRYEAAFGDEEDDGNGGTYSPVTSEQLQVEYVAPEDFAHTASRRWRDVGSVGRRLYLTKEAATARFGKEVAETLSYSERATGVDNITEDRQKSDGSGNLSSVKRAMVWEWWCRETDTIYFFTTEPLAKEAKGGMKGEGGIIETKDIPYKLHGFFPCPKPLYGLTTNNTLVPVPDYIQYQDQALQIDLATSRMGLMLNAIKVACLYDAALGQEIRQMFEGADLEAIPVQDFASKYAQQGGGLAAHLAFTPLDQFITAYAKINEGRDQLLKDVNLLTGIGDIMNSATDPSETLGAQKIKSGYFNQRLTERQNAMANFARDIIAIMAEIICQQFSDDTLLQMSGAQFMDPQSQMEIMPALELLHNANERTFRVEIETNSTVALEEADDKKQRLEFLTVMGTYLQKAIAMGAEQPLLAPVLKESVMFAIRGFKVGRQLEGQFEEALDRMVEEANKAQQAKDSGQTPPNPVMMKAQAEIQAEQAKTQAHVQATQVRAQTDVQTKMAKTQAELTLHQQEAQQDMLMNREILKAETTSDAQAKLIKAMMGGA